MELKHTPAPWGDTNKPVVVRGLTFVSHANYETEVGSANAKLIMAAPDLLEALILLEAEMVLSGNAQSRDYGWLPAITKTREAIAKATNAPQS